MLDYIEKEGIGFVEILRRCPSHTRFFFFPFQTIDQFEYDGCDNCDAYLQMKGNREMVYDCTSSSFDG